MSRKILMSLVCVAFITALVSYFILQSQRITEQKDIIQKQQTALGTVATVNMAQNATIKALRSEQKKNDELIDENARHIEFLVFHITKLDSELQEALNNEPVLTIDSVLPLDASNTFCMQWQAASGLYSLSANSTATTTQSAYARKGNSHATKRNPSDNCADWEKMTVRDAVEWNSQLLRHAGLERADKAALRKWAEQGE